MKTPNAGRILPIILAAIACANPSFAGSKVLIDFGNDESFRGVTTTSPDTNGKHWNSFKLGTFYTDLVDTTGSATTIDFGFDGSGQPVGTDSYNGPAGETDNPVSASDLADVEINAAALGDLGVNEAAIDYVSSTGGRFQLQGLDPLRRYRITFFGSSKFTTDEVSVYSVYDDSGFSNLIGTASLSIRDGASPWLHNQDQVAVIADLVPSSSGVLYVEFGGSGGNSGRINAMSIEDSPVEINGPTVLIDLGNDDSNRGVSVPGPDSNGNEWNSVRSGIYWTDLVDTAGNTTTIDFGFSTGVGSDSFNGPAGATSDPPTAGEIAATEIDGDVLGTLGVNEAAIDWVGGVDAGFEIAGLNPAGTYNLHFFGSKKYPTDGTTVYSVYDDSGLTNLIGETTLRVGKSGFANHNQSAVAVLRNLTPSAGGALYVSFVGESGNEGYLNALAVEVADTTAPEITITGDNPATVVWGDSYVDAGATALDDVDGVVAVTPGGSVDTSLLGSYAITYTATDGAGNVAQETRTVEVVLPANPTEPGPDGYSPLEKYALGAAGPDDSVERPVSSLSGGDLILTAVVRTNDPSLGVLGQSSIDLMGWTDLLVDPDGVVSSDQTGIPSGSERREFTLPGGGPERFLRLKVVSQ